MSIYISRSNDVPDEFLNEFWKHLRSVGYRGTIDFWKRGYAYSTEPLRKAKAIILLIDSSAALIGKGAYSEYIFALAHKIPIFLAYRTKNYGFQLYSFSAERVNNNFVGCAKVTFGCNNTEPILSMLRTGHPQPIGSDLDLDLDIDTNLKNFIEFTQNIELLLLRK